MADVITRFKLETTQYDSKLRDAAKGLQNVVNVAQNAGKGFTGFSQKAVEAARALGNTASGANNAKDKVRDLVGSFNDAAKAYNKLTEAQRNSDFGKELAASLQTLQGRIREAKQELYGLGDAVAQVKEKSSGGLFGEGGFTGMLAVTGGNLLASGIQKLGAEMADTIQQSIELAKSGEGVRLAFERLNQPGLLNNLKEATHGTVSELELMKAAVKFDDFKLPVEQLGTLLAFAQKKAKDTGQSVDYMVDSIVTGLGRKSLMILDNLGLSAAQIKEEMAKTGDMTSAVANIIKEQMSEAGEYVETAADRAARAAADAANQMEDLGRKAMPIAEAWATCWNSIKAGGMEVLTTVFGPLLQSAAQIQKILNGGGGFSFKPGIPNLADGAQSPWAGWKPGTDHTVKAPGGYVEVTDKNTGKVISGKHFDNLDDTNLINEWKKSLFKTGSSKTTSPAEQAAKKVRDAEFARAQAVEMATMEVKNGTATEAQAKQNEYDAMKSLWKAYGDAYNTTKDPKYKEAQDKLATELQAMGQQVTLSKEAQKQMEEAYRQVAAQTQKLASAQEEANKAISSGDLKSFYAADKKIVAAGGQSATTGMDMSQVFGATESNVQAFIGNLKQRIAEAPLGSELYNNLTAQLADASMLSNMIQLAMKNGVDMSQFDPKTLWTKIFGENPGDYIDDAKWEEIRAKMEEIIGKPIKINVNTGTVAEDGKDVEKKWNKAASAISSVGSAMSQIEDPAAKVMGTIAQAIASVALGYATASTQAATLGPWAWIAFAATGLVTMISMISGIHSATGYAQGGIVKGNSYSGDNIGGLVDGSQFVGLNAGEVVLNASQQQMLASNLQGEGGGGMRIVGVLKGHDMALMLDRWGMTTGRGELLFGKNL